jgi:hypothetical protein
VNLELQIAAGEIQRGFYTEAAFNLDSAIKFLKKLAKAKERS